MNTVYIICTTKSDFGVLRCAWFWSAGLFGTVVIEILHRFSDFTSLLDRTRVRNHRYQLIFDILDNEEENILSTRHYVYNITRE